MVDDDRLLENLADCLKLILFHKNNKWSPLLGISL